MHPTGALRFGAFTWSAPKAMTSHAESIPRGAYAPRSCCSASVCRQKTIFAIHIRTSGQERRASARRGSRIAPGRTIPGTSTHDHRTQHQERRASARRGSGIATARAIPHTSAHDRRTQRQERRPSARRGSGIAPAGRFDLRSANNATKSGGRQPAVAHESHLRGQFRAHPHTTIARSTRSGGRQPAVAHESHLQIGSICARRITPPGAAGVSAPWLTKPTCHAVRFTFGKPRLQRRLRSDRRGSIS
jgi:hypothetical protein